MDCYSLPNSHFSKHDRFIIIFHSIGKYIDLSQKFAFIYDIYPIEQVVLTTSKLFEMNGTYLFHYMTTSLLHSLRSLKTHRLKRALQIDKPIFFVEKLFNTIYVSQCIFDYELLV